MSTVAYSAMTHTSTGEHSTQTEMHRMLVFTPMYTQGCVADPSRVL